MYSQLGIEESVRNIFTAVIVGGLHRDNPKIATKRETFRNCMPRFLATFTTNIFYDEYAFFYEMLSKMKIKMFTQNQMETVLYRNVDLVLDSPLIDMTKWSHVIDGRSATDDEKIEAFRLNLIDLFNELSNETVDEEEFFSACEIYIAYYKDTLMLQTAQNMSLIMGDLGYVEKKPGKRSETYKGLDAAQRYYNDNVKVIRELSSDNRITSKVIDENWLVRELENEDKADNMSLFFTGLKEIDDVIGALRRTWLLGILGPTKGGKTKFTNYLVARALEEGLNVAVWPLEGNADEWESMQIAYMIRKQTGLALDSKKILEKKYDNDDIKQLVIATKIRLATDKNRGRLSFISGTAYVEDFLDVLKQHYDSENKFDVYAIDSMVNIMAKKRMAKAERISEGYMKLKDFTANSFTLPVLGLLPAQLKQVVIDNMIKNPEDDIEVTAGGESAETVRTPDETIGIFSTKDERKAGIMKFFSVASRHSMDFDNFAARAELGCCNFFSDSSLNQ